MSLRLLTTRSATLVTAMGALSLTLACGGATDDDGGSGGSGASNGSGDGSCDWQGQRYENANAVPSSDCNTCTCHDGEVSCTLLLCYDECEDPSVCDDCETLRTTIEEAIEEAKTCDPNAENQCTRLVHNGQACDCGTYVNEEATGAIARIEDAASDYGSLSCSGDVVCGPCPTFISSNCSAEGRCVDVWDNGGRACKVDGVGYAHGSPGIDDPRSCNECSCDDGELVCDAADCPEDDCPPSATFGTQCAQCGPADGCEVIEYTCLQICAEGCVSGECVEGYCKNLCG